MNSIFRWLFGSSARSRHVLALVDIYRHTRGGHFGYYLRWFASEFAKRFDEVYVVTKKPRLAQSLFDAPGGQPRNVSFHRVPARLRDNFDLGALREVGRARRRKLSAFFMWGYDLVELPTLIEGDPPIPWATFASISWLKRGHTAQTAIVEKRMQDLFNSSPSCRAFLHPDQYLAGSEKSIWLPDLEDVARPQRPTPLADRIRSHAAGRFCIGAFGQITGYRCLNELLPLAVAQPDICFVVAGKIFEETVEPELRPLLRERALANLLVVPGFVETEEELNDAIAAADAVFIDGTSYPVQSGIVCKGIEMGRCTVTPRSNSWTNDFLHEWGVGIAYESRSDRLAEAWERWKANGGEARSRAASSFMRDPSAVAASFDRVTSVLTRDCEKLSSRSERGV